MPSWLSISSTWSERRTRCSCDSVSAGAKAPLPPPRQQHPGSPQTSPCAISGTRSCPVLAQPCARCRKPWGTLTCTTQAPPGQVPGLCIPKAWKQGDSQGCQPSV